MNILIRNFKKHGYVSIGRDYLNLSKNEISKLSYYSKNIYDDQSLKLKKIPAGGDSDVIENICLYNNKLTLILSKLLSCYQIKSFLREILGKNYKIWAINFRRSNVGDSGLYLHQDGVGQVNMAILLDDNLSGDGSTIFLGGSHLIKKSQKIMNFEIPVILLRIFFFLFSKAKGKQGDVIFFSNKIWHGRAPNSSMKNYDILLIGFFPYGYSYNSPWPDDFLLKNKKNYIGRYLATKADKVNSIYSNCDLRDSKKFIFDSKHHGFSMQIERDDCLIKNKLYLKLKFSLLLLSIVFLLRFIKKIIRIMNW